MSFIKEFKEFAMRGNVMDLAVGVVIGGAFGKIVSSMVENLITPIVGVFSGGVKVDFLKLVLKDGEGDLPPVTLNYGAFLQSVIDFIILAFVIFLMVKFMNKLRKTEPPPPAATPEDILLLREIRDQLARR